MKEVKLKDLCDYWFRRGITSANLRLIHECMEIITEEDDDPRQALSDLVLVFLKLNIKAGQQLNEIDSTLEQLGDSNDIIYMEDEEDDTTTSD